MLSVTAYAIAILLQVSAGQTSKSLPGCASNPDSPMCKAPPPAQPLTSSARATLTARSIADEQEAMDAVKSKDPARCQAGAAHAESKGRFDLKRMIERQCGNQPLGAK